MNVVAAKLINFDISCVQTHNLLMVFAKGSALILEVKLIA